jgi:hypothetical protein
MCPDRLGDKTIGKVLRKGCAFRSTVAPVVERPSQIAPGFVSARGNFAAAAHHHTDREAKGRALSFLVSAGGGGGGNGVWVSIVGGAAGAGGGGYFNLEVRIFIMTTQFSQHCKEKEKEKKRKTDCHDAARATSNRVEKRCRLHFLRWKSNENDSALFPRQAPDSSALFQAALAPRMDLFQAALAPRMDLIGPKRK